MFKKKIPTFPFEKPTFKETLSLSTSFSVDITSDGFGDVAKIALNF